MTNPLRPLKILLVEDSPTLRHVLTGDIRHAGHEVIIAQSGEEALQIVESTTVDMILMDVEMPGASGHGGPQALDGLCPQSVYVER